MVAGGMEYGDECYCSDVSDVVAHPNAVLTTESDCNTPCTSNATIQCGAGNRINHYKWDNINTWHYALGNAAGEYEFLIGGVVTLDHNSWC